jgi:hypothetical protein
VPGAESEAPGAGDIGPGTERSELDARLSQGGLGAENHTQRSEGQVLGAECAVPSAKCWGLRTRREGPIDGGRARAPGVEPWDQALGAEG